MDYHTFRLRTSRYRTGGQGRANPKETFSNIKIPAKPRELSSSFSGRSKFLNLFQNEAEGRAPPGEIMDDSRLYIEIPRSKSRPVRIDVVLAKRMKEFLLSRRRELWRREGR